MQRTISRMSLGLAALLLFAAALAPHALLAQIDTGGITGTVMDPSRAVIPSAKITLTNQATGVVNQTESTSAGTYSLTGIQPGTYTLRAAAPGFQIFLVQGLDVHIEHTLTVDVQFVTGSVNEQVTVTAATPLLQAESASVGQTITGQSLNDLPLNGRNWDSLAQLSAGTSTAPVGGPTGDSGSTASAYFSVNGVSLWQNDFRLNGINDNIEVYGGASLGRNAAIVPPPDAIEEFKLQSGDYSAEFGHSTGGVINAALKSGTNNIHGDLWEYLRNDLFDANLYFNRNIPKSEYRQNQFGGTVGGPVTIPRIYSGQDRTFFFFDYEGLRLVEPSASTSTVPTENMVNSQFTNLQDLITYRGGSATDALNRIIPHGTVLDPATTRSVAPGAIDAISGLPNTSSSTIYVRDPFYTGGSVAGITNFTTKTSQLNILPAQRLDPIAVKLLGLYPAPTSAGFSNNFYYVPKSPTTGNLYDIRVDQSFGSKNHLFGVYDRSLRDNPEPGALPGIAVGQHGSVDNSYPAYAIAAGDTISISPTLLNELHVGFLHQDQFIQDHYGNTMGVPAQYGISGVPQMSGNGGLPPISMSGMTGLGESVYSPTLSTIYSLEAADSDTWVHGKSVFKAGVQVDDLTSNITQPPYGRGQFSYTGQFTDIPGQSSSLNGISDFLLTPIPSTVGGIDNVGGLTTLLGSNFNATINRRWYTALFFQDDWKLTDRLTLNLGARWDYFTPYTEVDGREANFAANDGNGNSGVYYMHQSGCSVARSASFDALLAASNIALQCTSDRYLGNSQKLNFAPRVGFAYRITPQLVIRSGYAIEYGALGNIGYGGTLGTNYPFIYNVSFPAPDSQHPLVLPNSTQTARIENALESVNLENPAINSGQGVSLYGRTLNYQTPYVQVTNLTVQDQLTQHDTIQAGYVGTFGRHLNSMDLHNSPSELLPPTANVQDYVPFPSFARNSNFEVTSSKSSYNSLQVIYEHQLSAGLSVLANYTWSKCFGNQRTQSTTTPTYRATWLPGFGDNKDYALCDTDATHIVHVSGAYALPIGTGKAVWSSANRVTDAFIGGWQVNWIYSVQTGQPFTVSCPVTTAAGLGCFAPLASGVHPYSGPHNITQWLNPSAFMQPNIVTQIGETDYSVLGGPPSQVRGPRLNNVDASVFKYFNVSDSIRLQFRAEAFDATNTPAFGQPGNLNFTVPTNFSQITGTKNGPRVVQFALKLFY
ncbi:MAG TPA: carboxypeptidase regulatory-like domain-containing protein [Edaphobacter sp.]|nr:carboxypeptidase regulatory-like domain-containing protein [Edaphobacter sp.]